MVLKMPAIAASNANLAAADGGNGLAAQRHQREEALRLRELKGEKEGFVEVCARPCRSALSAALSTITGVKPPVILGPTNIFSRREPWWGLVT
ncbi:hypothetical protein [Pseudorhizobium flavum]|uniref:hypothetical protein n=1 Tax=Pseudorhizobium flavum TaxID=1335061 RepID=UPI00376FDB3B